MRADPHGFARALRLAAPALLLAAAATLPFLTRAFTIDDTLFLRQAHALTLDPFHPTAFEMVWTDRPMRMSAIMPSGPVMAYLLVPSILGGGSEWIAHVTQLLLLGCALVATVSLALRFGLTETGSRWAGLLLAGTPAVLAMSTTAMPDVAAMALGTIGMERFVAWRDDGRITQGLAAMAALALAALTRSHEALLLGVAAFALTPRRWWPLVGCPVLIAILLLVTRDPWGPVGLVGAMGSFAGARAIRGNLFAFLVHLALCFPLALAWLILRVRAVPWRWLGVTLPVSFLLLRSTHALEHWTLWLDGSLVAIAGLSGLALIDIASDAWKRRDRAQRLLFAWLLVALPVAVYIHLPSKYLLASAPAIALLVARESGQRRRVIVTTLAAGLVLGVLIARADARFAGLDRDAVARWVPQAVESGKRVWVSGHWGFQWYAERAGALPLTVTPPFPEPGDLVIASKRCDGSVARFPRRRRIDSISDTTPGGRLMSNGAGFYSNGWGYLPWAWGSGEIDRIELWEIE